MTASLAEKLAALSEEKRAAFVASLSDSEARLLPHTWEFWGRPEQHPPPTDWFCWFIRTGRGWGKTRTGSEWILKRVREGARHIALIGQTTADVRDTMIEIGDSAILKIASKDEMPDYEPSKRRLVFPNGAVATSFSGDKPDQLRGPQHDTVWIDELAKFQYP
ncbi:MAG: terminase family protein, partial [Dehalococcoidia bacterium]